jgi:hypothetical protein
VRADEDTIREQLQTAKTEYDDELDRVHALVMTSLETKLAAAKKAGSLEQVETIQAEIDAFDAEDQLPTSVSTREYKRAMSKASKKLEMAFIDARKAYVKADKTDEAKAIQTELDEFNASVSAELDPKSGAINGKLLKASRSAMADNPRLYFYVCTTSLGERVIRATRRRFSETPNGNHPEQPRNPLKDVRLSSFGGEPTPNAVRQLVKMCETHNAKIQD